MTFDKEYRRTQKAVALQQGLDQLAGAATRIVAVTQNLTTLRQSLVTSEDFTQDDIDSLDALSQKVSALNSAAQTYLA